MISNHIFYRPGKPINEILPSFLSLENLVPRARLQCKIPFYRLKSSEIILGLSPPIGIRPVNCQAETSLKNPLSKFR